MARSSLKLHANSRLDSLKRARSVRTVSWPAGQISNRHVRRQLFLAALAAICMVAGAACRANPVSDSSTTGGSKSGVPRGGELLVSVRSEPRSFNRHAARDTTTSLVSNLTQARLVRVNQATQVVEPSL